MERDEVLKEAKKATRHLYAEPSRKLSLEAKLLSLVEDFGEVNINARMHAQSNDGKFNLAMVNVNFCMSTPQVNTTIEVMDSSLEAALDRARLEIQKYSGENNPRL